MANKVKHQLTKEYVQKDIESIEQKISYLNNKINEMQAQIDKHKNIPLDLTITIFDFYELDMNDEIIIMDGKQYIGKVSGLFTQDKETFKPCISCAELDIENALIKYNSLYKHFYVENRSSHIYQVFLNQKHLSYCNNSKLIEQIKITKQNIQIHEELLLEYQTKLKEIENRNN